jgi:hypothetical protein
MRYFLSDDDRQAPRLSRDSELCSVVIPMLGAQEMRGQSTSAAYQRSGRPKYAERHTSSSGPRSAGYVSRLLGAVARLMRLAPFMAGFALLLAPVCLQAQTNLGNPQTLSLTLNAAAFLYSVPATTTLSTTGTAFNVSGSTGSMTMTYKHYQCSLRT